MPDQLDAETLLYAAGWLAAGTLAGLLLRMLFGWLARRAGNTSVTWDDVGWALLRILSLPSAVIAGAWAAAEALQLRPPVAGIVDRAFLAAIVLAAALAIARLAAEIVRTVAIARTGTAQSATIFINLTKILVVTIGILVVLQSVGISITPLVTALGVGGIGLALALQETLSNLFAGVQVIASKKVQPGDFIRLDSGEDGYIVDITWRNTTIRALAGNIVIVPNSRLASAILTNFHKPMQTLDIWFQLGVSYHSDLEHVERVTVEVAEDVMATVPGGVPEFQPAVRFSRFGDSSIDFTVILQTTEFLSQYLVVHEFVKRLHARYRAEEIQIPFPIRTLVMADGAKPAGPPTVSTSIPGARPAGAPSDRTIDVPAGRAAGAPGGRTADAPAPDPAYQPE